MANFGAKFKEMKKIYVLHENSEWVEPLRRAFVELKLPYEEWFINTGKVSLSEVPPEGVFYNRMSASSHTRDHRYAVEFTEPIISWLEANGRRVINDRRALQLETRKFEQYLKLNSFDIKTPATVAATGKDEVLSAIKQLGKAPFMLKPNRGGKGAGVQLFNSLESVESTMDGQLESLSLDGITLVQEYIKPVDSCIVRVEFIGGKFYYAVKVDASGGFELCPADACEVGDDFCPTDSDEAPAPTKFEILSDYQNPDIPKYEAFLKANGFEVAAIEYVENEAGERIVYDVNMNTNYNSQAEANNGNQVRGMFRIAQFLGEELSKV